MYIQHNMAAMTANRLLRSDGRKKLKVSEKLSSGYRINRAADDASGLSISEKMRGQIRGLHQASDNIQDGISLIQTAEGALQETESILQRMRELSVQAANDTNVTADREAIQLEMDQLSDELDRIAEHTEFNNGIYPLLGAGDPRSQMMKYLTEITATVTVSLSVMYDGVAYQAGDTFKVTGVNVHDYNSYNPLSYKGYFCMGYLHGHIRNGDDLKRHFSSLDPMHAPHRYSTLTLNNFKVDEEGRIYCQYESKKDYFTINNGAVWYAGDNPDINAPDILRIGSSEASSSLWIQAGANANQGINISLVDGTAAGLGLTSVNVMSNTEAGNAIQTVDNAISQVNRYRSDFGAQQNRLEHAMAVDDNTAENLQAAESRIRDLDMADEMVENAKLAIMEQSMQAMLANANHQTEGVLALLQG